MFFEENFSCSHFFFFFLDIGWGGTSSPCSSCLPQSNVRKATCLVMGLWFQAIFVILCEISSIPSICNKKKGWISKRVFQEKKACQIFQKMIISYTMIHIRPFAYKGGVRNVPFLKNLACFVFLKHPLWDSPFCLITDQKHFWLLLFHCHKII